MSIFTPQRGAANVECLTADERRSVVEILLRVRQEYPKLDMLEGMIKELLSPPESPDRCIFAQTTCTLSADFKTRVEPCQFGGDPDCSRCGCIASMRLAAWDIKSLSVRSPPGTSSGPQPQLVATYGVAKIRCSIS